MESDEEIQESIFPYELEELIFTEAVRLSPSSAKNFMLVARRVHEWVAHVVYGVCCRLGSPEILDTQRPTSSLPYFGPFVKHLIIGGATEEEDIECFLDSCTNLIELALYTPHPTKRFLHLFQNMKLQRLSTDLSSLSEADFKGPYLSSITHLDVTVLEEKQRWKALENLPALTHLAINDFVDQETVQYLLKHCPKLRILLIIQELPHILYTKFYSAEIFDPRFVRMNISRFILKDRDDGTVREDDFWKCAESISAAKYRMSFKKADFCTWFSPTHWREELDALEQAYSGSL